MIGGIRERTRAKEAYLRLKGRDDSYVHDEEKLGQVEEGS